MSATPEQTAVMLCELLCPVGGEDETIRDDLQAVRKLVEESPDALLAEIDTYLDDVLSNIAYAKQEARREGGVPECYGIVRGVDYP